MDKINVIATETYSGNTAYSSDLILINIVSADVFKKRELISQSFVALNLLRLTKEFPDFLIHPQFDLDSITIILSQNFGERFFNSFKKSMEERTKDISIYFHKILNQEIPVPIEQ